MNLSPFGLSLTAALLCANFASAEPTEAEKQRFIKQFDEKSAAQIQRDCLARATNDEERAACNVIHEALTFEQATPEQKKEKIRRGRDNCVNQAKANRSPEMTESHCETIFKYRMNAFAPRAEQDAFFQKHREACEAKAGASKARCAKIKAKTP